MRGAGDPDAGVDGLHPVLRRAARGALPPWARASRERREHLDRVAGLMRSWADGRGGADPETERWAAAGFLHDALRDAPPDELRDEVSGADERALPDPLLHGPAAAARLRREGVDDDELLEAVAHHTLGHPGFRALGRALYCADFLDPGRDFRRQRRRELRRRMPDELDGVTREVLADRIRYLLDRGHPVFPRTIRFWNRVVEGR